MPDFTEDLGAFLQDFGVNATSGGTTRKVIFDMPGSDILGGRMSSTGYEITYITTDFPNLSYKNIVVINSVTYTAKDPNFVGDGSFSRAELEKP